MSAQRDPYESPAVRAFAVELEVWRTQARLSKLELAERLGYTPQLIGQIESAKNIPSRKFAEDLDTYFATNGLFVRLWELINDTRHVASLPPGFPEFVEREAEAAVMHIFESNLVTGLFQKESYARELLKAGRSPEAVEQLVTTRMKRQEILGKDNPPRIIAVFDEAVIRCLESHPEIMRDQVGHLAKLTYEPRITIQFVPSGTGLYAGLAGAFTILSFDEGPDVAYIEGPAGGQLISRPATVRECALRFDTIRGDALRVEESRTWIESILESL